MHVRRQRHMHAAAAHPTGVGRLCALVQSRRKTAEVVHEFSCCSASLAPKTRSRISACRQSRCSRCGRRNRRRAAPLPAPRRSVPVGHKGTAVWYMPLITSGHPFLAHCCKLPCSRYSAAPNMISYDSTEEHTSVVQKLGRQPAASRQAAWPAADGGLSSGSVAIQAHAPHMSCRV